MKLPFELGVKLLYRLLLPGFTLTLGLSPLIFFILDWINWPESHVYFFLGTIIVAGWFVLILDMPIYMWFEGRRYWPPFLRTPFVQLENWRLERIRKRSALSVIEAIETREKQLDAEIDQAKKATTQRQIRVDERIYLEALFDIRNFPMDDNGEHRATFPTRLGNLIDAFEDYSTRVYGMDSVFYWPRLWLKLDKDLKEDIDNRQAVVDSTIYVAFACFVDAVIWILFGLVGTINSRIVQAEGKPRYIFPHTLFDHLPPSWMVWIIALMFLLIGFFVYRLSLRLHAQFGEVFKSVFDVFHDEVDVSGVMDEIAKLSLPSFLTLPQKQRFQAARRYLQFGLIKCPFSGCEKRIPASGMKEHLKTHQQTVTSVQPLIGRYLAWPLEKQAVRRSE